MFKSAATKIAHNSTLPSLGGNKDLRPLQDLITAEKSVLVSLQKLSIDLAKSSEALRAWGLGEGEDLGDTLSASTTILGHFSIALSRYATHEHTIRDHMKAVRTREEALDELKRRRKSVASKADSAERKLSKMSPENKNLSAQTDLLNQLRDQMRSLDAEIMGEEARLSDFKRESTRSWMALKFGGLVECSEKGMIVGDIGKQIIAEIPQEVTQPGSLPRNFYTGHARTEFLTSEAQRSIEEVVFSNLPSASPGAMPTRSTDEQPQSYSSGPSPNMPSMPEPSLAPTPSSYLSTPQPGSGPGLGTYLNPSEVSAINQAEPGAAAWDTMPQPQTLVRGASVDDFGVGNSMLSPRLGVRGSGGAGKFATFPVKGRQPLSVGEQDNSSSFSSSVADALQGGKPSVDDPVPEYSSVEQDGSGSGSQAGSYAPPPGPPPGAAPALADPWTDSPGLQPGYGGNEESSDEGHLAYLGDGQRGSRHVRFGEDQMIGHGVGVVDTPTTEASFRSTPTAMNFAGEQRYAIGIGEEHSPIQQQPPPQLSSGQQQPPASVPAPSPAPPPAPQSQQERPHPASYRVPPPPLEESASQQSPKQSAEHGLENEDEKALNAAAAREISREMDSLTFSPPAQPTPPSPPPRIETSISPPAPTSTAIATEQTPTSSLRTRSPTTTSPTSITTSLSAQIPPARPEPQSRTPLAPPALSLPSRSISPLSSTGGSPYCTPPEYPRMNKSTSSLGGGSPTIPQGVRTISAAAFRRPAPRMPSGDGPAGLPDVPALTLKKRTLPSSPYPQRREQDPPSGPRGRSDSGRVPAPLPPPPAPEEEEDFDYLSAYVDGGAELDSGSPRAVDHGSLGAVHVANGSSGSPGYSRGNFSTNLEEGGLR